MRFHIKHLTIEISFPLAAVMTLVILYDSSLSVTACFICILLHEAGHLLMLKRYGSMPKHIRLTLFDIAIIDKSKDLRETGKELAIVTAGIISNLIFACISILLFYLYGGHFFELLFNTNMTLAIFNALPIDSLDGGQTVYLLLCLKTDPDRALNILDILSVIVLIPTACLGFLVLLQSKYNFTLLLTALYLLCAIGLRRSKLRK